MATGPVKSKPLHNFALPCLKWGGKNHTNGNSRFRPSIAGESAPADDHSELESDSDSARRSGARTSRIRFSFNSCSVVDQSKPREKNKEGDEVKEVKQQAEGESEKPQKPWNLRPRKGVSSKIPLELMKNVGDFYEPDGTVQVGENGQPKSLRLRDFTESQSMEKKEKRKFWIALSKEEIEEDVFIMTGSRPARRPRKRPKNLQKQIDNVFPGLWLVGATVDYYRAVDSPAKR